MSTFNTRKDRNWLGKPKPHQHVSFPSRDGKMKHYDEDVRNYHCNYSKNPGWWDNLCTTRANRAGTRAKLRELLKGIEPEGILWLPNNRPRKYYW
ncbi:hypothetical protein [Yersinia aldovae]|uniref:hypothetical protein n=1 Tax=Yersinia aldovae TaxID=29483 RepID=UPI0011A13DDA|nr:hypothetical protein [Yersinia aldovae]